MIQQTVVQRRHAVGYRRYAVQTVAPGQRRRVRVQFRPGGQFPCAVQQCRDGSHRRFTGVGFHITVQPGRAGADFIQIVAVGLLAGLHPLPQQECQHQYQQVPAEAQQAVTPGPLEVWLHQVRFTKNKLCQQVMQEVAAVAVRQSVWERGGGFATGGFYRPDKALPDTQLVGHGVGLRLRGAGEKHPAQRVIQLRGIEF
ncbi:Uncharacterised protein [Salmonella enterica subsp. enterica serovar Typhimurium str. DT104]|nr:Uncharacterised protein [Salmonella enterica subsp. enterica serovar Typhimurium str. DT104]CQF53860.1 Uncharacterised protein [Salmonella enterica subsp. enterica serovar Typhimurium str. DT104]CQG78827.1 Uncharacterised protein [Salmonella enterica subsp. enterica serovar Typhimurium str. DT104]